MGKSILNGDIATKVFKFYEPFLAYYADEATCYYENRGQIEQALAEWKSNSALDNKAINSKYCQALLKSTNATDKVRYDEQKKWFKKHAITLDDDNLHIFEPYNGNRKITIGYHCSWWDSTTMRGQATPFISEHDHNKFNLICYSLGKCSNDIVELFDSFVNVSGYSDIDYAKKVRKDKVDALVEFTGFSPHNRFSAMGARCAPVQISYLNHAGTSGIPNVDYIIADKISAPNSIDKYYTEEIYRLPGTFFNFNYDWDEFPITEEPPCLKNEVITFGCFGSQSKINDKQIYIWSKLLLAIPNSRLFIRNIGLNTKSNRAFMLRRFSQWGVSTNRLRISRGGDRNSILKSYSDVDISLDTFPYNGGNTIAESIWCGVPIITLTGENFASCYGASLLSASGCSNLIASDTGSFIKIAKDLAEDIDRLIKLRKNLRAMMKENGFADSRHFIKKWEEMIVILVKNALKKY